MAWVALVVAGIVEPIRRPAFSLRHASGRRAHPLVRLAAEDLPPPEWIHSHADSHPHRRKPKSAEFKATVRAAVHEALVGIDASPDDRIHRVFELEEENFQLDSRFPDVQTRRNNDFVLIEILLGVGRSVKRKRQVLAAIVD